MIDLQIEDHPSEGTWRDIRPLVLMQQLVASVMLDLLAVAGRELLKAHQHRRQDVDDYICVVVGDLGAKPSVVVAFARWASAAPPSLL